MVRITGVARVDRKTKALAKRLQPGEIAVIDHPDLDEVAALSLIEAGVRAVVNAAGCTTGRYPNVGPRILIDAGVPVIDRAGPGVMNRIYEGATVQIDHNRVILNGATIAVGDRLTPGMVEARTRRALAGSASTISEFVDNTLAYAQKEKELMLGRLSLPPLSLEIRGRQVVVVVRGSRYKDDLKAIASYIDEVRPVLIGVDGGADALLENGYTPHLIVGDMDSVSDEALRSGAELVVHAYPDGRAPGAERVQTLGLEPKQIAAPGTSEDIALLMAHDMGADLIVAVGTHSNWIDFLEKGRPGMASTFLARMKVGAILVDARGVGRLYHGQPKKSYLVQVAVAALVPLALVSMLAEPIRQTIRLMVLSLRVWLKG